MPTEAEKKIMAEGTLSLIAAIAGPKKLLLKSSWHESKFNEKRFHATPRD